MQTPVTRFNQSSGIFMQMAPEGTTGNDKEKNFLQFANIYYLLIKKENSFIIIRN